MKYIISNSHSDIPSSIRRECDTDIITFLESNLAFNTIDFDTFILILCYFPESVMEALGEDKIKVSRSEHTIFMSVKIYTEFFLDDTKSYEDKLEYQKKRINEVKTSNLSRLKKIGLL